jgi:large subunit ribosomal protein L37Ae
VGRKKKIGTAGRFGSRYGKKDRQQVADIEKIQKQRHTCPRCGLPYVKRESTGIWKCKKCGNRFAGMAYYPRSEAFLKRSD